MMFKKKFFFEIFQKLKSFFNQSGYYGDFRNGFSFRSSSKIFFHLKLETFKVELRLGSGKKSKTLILSITRFNS